MMGQFIIEHVSEYQTNLDGTNNGVSLNSLYRTGGMLKIKLNEHI